MYQTYSQTLNYTPRILLCSVECELFQHIVFDSKGIPSIKLNQPVNFKLVKHSKPEIYELYLRNDDRYENRLYVYQPLTAVVRYILCFRIKINLFKETYLFQTISKMDSDRKKMQMIDHVKDFQFVKT